MTLAGPVNVTGGLTINRGTLRLSGNNAALAGPLLVSGAGPTYGTLALGGENLGSAIVTLERRAAAVRSVFAMSALLPRCRRSDFRDARSVVGDINSPLTGAGG